MKKRFTLFALTTLAIILTACRTVPETGRKGLSLVSDEMLANLSEVSFNQLKEKDKVSKNKAYNQQLDRVARAIITQANQTTDLPPVSQWEWVVFDNDEVVNAFAMPGGKIGVYTGMFDLIETDDDLAVVIGHEVAHVAAHHGNERVSRVLLITGVGIGLGVATGGQDADTQRAILAAYGLGSTVGVALPFSRRDESEADHIGLLYSSRAGYDPRVSIPFWEKMGAQSKFKMPEFLSTHPSHNTRIRNLEVLMPQALAEYNEATRNK
tara:strand:+ start:86858 stop:87658 length:801 start_codon:yes stop_codon:yes gene_type:complete